MKRIFAVLASVLLLLTACAAPNETPNDQTGTTEPPQVETGSENSETTGTEPEAEPETVARFELNETFQNLLDEVNAAHEAVKMYDGDYEKYFVQNEEPGFNIEDYTLSIMSGIDGTASNDLPSGTTVLTLDQVKEDLDICYKALRTKYGCYEYFGGDEAFRPAIDAVIADCAEMETITFSAMSRSLREHLAFIKDMHFEINGSSLDGLDGYKYIVPFHFRNVAYIKTENGYETQDGRVVVSVDGYEDLDELFKLSLTKEGDLVYYPILLEPSILLLGPANCSTPELTVRYADGSTDTLTTGTFRYALISSTSRVDIREENGIPVITVGNLGMSDTYKFTSSGTDYRDRDIVMLDLRSCSGGVSVYAESWIEKYAGRFVWSNAMRLREGDSVHPSTQYGLNHADVEFAPMDSVCIMLTGKGTSSAGQMLVDLGYNMENTLIIGENTIGNLIGSTGYVVKLPNSGGLVEFGPSLVLYPDGYFEEYRGFYPDIWVPAAEAEEAVMNFIAKNTMVTYE